MKKTIIFLLLFAVADLTLAQGKLEKAKDDLSDKSSSDKSGSYSSDVNDDSDDLATALIGGLIVDIFYYSSAWLLIGEVQPRSFYPFPYAEGKHGEYDSVRMEILRKTGLAILTNTIVYQPDLLGNDFSLNLRPHPVIGFELNHLHFFDVIGEEEELGLTSVMVDFYRIRERQVTGYWGIGGTYAGSGVDTWGIAYNVGLDIYVGKPVSLGFYWKQSFINESSVNEFRGLIRYHFQKLDIHGGLHHYKIGSVNFPCVALGVGYRL